MEPLYALGVSCIEFIQYWFRDYKRYFELVNDIANPHYALELVFPLLSIIDSVFAAQFIFCIGFGGWLNSVMKWWFLEERPYWWVKETTYYTDRNRPRLHQTSQTCETGPGSPSGHSTHVAIVLMLVLMWISHVMNDRKRYVWWWKYVAYPLCAFALGSAMLARMFVAAHFPHQCVIGAAIGLFLAPALCIYVTDPYIWGAEGVGPKATSALLLHICSALTTILIAIVTYYSLKMCGVDPQWSIKLAFKWCSSPDHIHVSTTPMYALVQSTASLLGCAIAIVPSLDAYRHYTKDRSLAIASVSTLTFAYSLKLIQNNINRDITWCFYSMQFVVYCLKPILFLRWTPWLAMLPYRGKDKID